MQYILEIQFAADNDKAALDEIDEIENLPEGSAWVLRECPRRVA